MLHAQSVLTLVIDDQGATLVPVVDDLDAFRDLIDGGWLEAIHPDPRYIDEIDFPPWHAYVDEEGRLKQLAPNLTATRLARHAGWMVDQWLLGPVVFVGDGPNGTEASVPAPLCTLARAYILATATGNGVPILDPPAPVVRDE